MATNRNSEHLRYRYGICLNDNCQKCKNKEVQQISVRKDFVCEECGKPLRECPPPKSGPKMKFIAAIIAIVVIIAGIGFYFEFGRGETSVSAPVDSVGVQKDSLDLPRPSDTVTIVRTDTVVKKETVVVKNQAPAKEKSQPSTITQSSGSIRLSYGSYSGSTQSGKPHGPGRMTFTSSHIIDSRDSKNRVADAGDYVIGEWNNGNLVQGRWYGADGNVKGSIIIGM